MNVRVARLTPEGTGAIAVIAVAGPDAWQLVQPLFRRDQQPTGAPPQVGQNAFGQFGPPPGDDVVLAVLSDRFEIHCHGGIQVVDWLLEQLAQRGAVNVHWSTLGLSRAGLGEGKTHIYGAEQMLTQASTLRTAGILLDQAHGAFERAIRLIVADINSNASTLHRLAHMASLGRHLVMPWQVALCGAPNVGKSSLINALAGFQRAVVTPTPGTTRDVASVNIALDGWPVTLLDTAGVRDHAGELEGEGIRRGQAAAATADLVIWVRDATIANPSPANPQLLVVANKSDLVSTASTVGFPVSALTGAGIPHLIEAIVQRLVPITPLPGEPVPFTTEWADAVEKAANHLKSGNAVAAVALLTALLSPAEPS